MGPKGKSKALTLKHSYLGQFTKNARKVDEMKVLIPEQEKILSDLKDKQEELTTGLQKQQRVIKTVKRKLSHKNDTLNDLTGKVKNVDLKLTKLKMSSHFENAFTISKRKKRQRKQKPSNRFLSHTSKVVRRSETYEACSAIHGASSENIEPLIHGMVDTLTSKIKAKDLCRSVLSAKSSFVNEVESNVILKWKTEYYQSRDNLLKSLNVYYSHNVMGKAKYKAIRKANKSKFSPNYVSYSKLASYIRDTDIGLVEDVQEKYVDGIVGEEPVDGVCRSLAQYALRLAEFYIAVNENRTDKILDFKAFPKKNTESLLFVMAIGGDGAPGTGTSFLISFINSALRIASSSENFLLFGANVSETATVVKRYVTDLFADVQYLESKVFDVNEKCYPVEFKLGELPNDMKMLCFLGGELSNSALYFSTFANVNKKTCGDVNKSISRLFFAFFAEVALESESWTLVFLLTSQRSTFCCASEKRKRKMSDSEKSEISLNEDFTLFEDEEEFSSSKSESDISFDEEFSLFEDASKLTPFNFEPLLSSSDEDEYHTAEEGELRNEKRISRLDNLNWCKCRKCVVMETNLECICCQELNEVSDEKLEGKKK